MLFRVNLRRSGGVFETLAEQARNPKQVLRRFAGFLRTKAKARIEGGGLAPLAASTQAKYEHTRTAAVTVRGTVRKSYAKQLDRRLRRTPDARAELRRLINGGNTGAAYSVLEGDEKRKRRLAVDRLRRNLAKAQATGKVVGGDARKADKHQILGKARTAWEVYISKTSAKLRSALPFSEVLFKGGRVGNNAVLPERNVLFIDGSDVTELAKIALDWLMGRKH